MRGAARRLDPPHLRRRLRQRGVRRREPAVLSARARSAPPGRSPSGAGGSRGATRLRLAACSWRWSLLLAACAVGAVGATHLIDFGAYDLRYRVLNANSSASWSHAVSAGALALAAAACAVGARRLPRRRAAWVASAAMLGLFFLDEISGVHAQIDSLMGHGKLLYAPILLVLVLCVWRLTAATAHLVSVRAGAALLAASYVIHVLEPHEIARALGWRAGGWAFQVVVSFKEGMELAGLLLVLLALSACALAPAGAE